MDSVDQLYIGGAFVRGAGASVPLFDPASARQNGTLLSADAAQVERAVAAAEALHRSGWGQQPIASRIPVLERIIGLIEEAQYAFAMTISAEVGAPIDFALGSQVATSLKHFKAYCAAAADLQDEILTDISAPDHRVRYAPLGVAALITPWNWPLNQAALKIGAALLGGCPMVLKGSELTPRTNQLLAEVIANAGLPDGAFNLLQGGADVGSALIAAPEVRVISFTGSTSVGQKIAIAAAPDFKKTILELGGKSPNILLADCDLAQAIKDGTAHCFRNTGQSCNAASLMLVEEPIYAHAVELAAQAAAETTLGLPKEAGKHLGPLVSQEQCDRVRRLILSGHAEGARLVAGGADPVDGLEGYYVRPTVFADVTPDMSLFATEIFGPVLSMMPVSSADHAIDVANALPYGLAAYIQTRNARKADRIAKALEVGTLQVNGQSRLFGTPFGGQKRSGLEREGGKWGIRAFQYAKTISGVSAS